MSKNPFLSNANEDAMAAAPAAGAPDGAADSPEVADVPEVPADGGAGAPPAEAEAVPAAPGGETPPKESKRDKFRSRMKERYPDLDIDDEDAYYDQMGSAFDDYEGYEKNTETLRNSMDKSPAMAEMLLAARDQDDFDPLVWMVRQKGLDLDAVRDNPEYAEKLAKAHNEYVEQQAKGKEYLEEMKSNLPSTVEAQQKALEEAGLGDKSEEVIGQIFQMLEDISRGKWDPQIGVMLAKGGDFDKAVSAAHDEGQAEGLNTKVTDKVRKLNARQEHVSGTQTPVKPKEPEKKNSNMFLA